LFIQACDLFPDLLELLEDQGFRKKVIDQVKKGHLTCFTFIFRAEPFSESTISGNGTL